MNIGRVRSSVNIDEGRYNHTLLNNIAKYQSNTKAMSGNIFITYTKDSFYPPNPIGNKNNLSA